MIYKNISLVPNSILIEEKPRVLMHSNEHQLFLSFSCIRHNDAMSTHTRSAHSSTSGTLFSILFNETRIFCFASLSPAFRMPRSSSRSSRSRDSCIAHRARTHDGRWQKNKNMDMLYGVASPAKMNKCLRGPPVMRVHVARMPWPSIETVG